MNHRAFFDGVSRAIRDAERDGLLYRAEDGILDGLSGEKVIGAMQRSAALFGGADDACYLEVGVFQGLTLLSIAASAPDTPCYGVDDFVHFDTTGRNFALVKERREKLDVRNAHVIDQDYEDAFADLSAHIGDRRIGVYFVDGGHDYRSQLMCLMVAMPFLHDQCVIFVDDANYRHVRQANRDFLATHPEFALIFEGYTAGHPDTLDESELAASRQGWWNGINVMVRDPERLIGRRLPPTERGRTLYENEHLVHRLAMAEIAPEAVRFAGTLAHGGEIDADLDALRTSARALRERHPGRLPDKNTYSRDLPASAMNWNEE